MIKTPDAVAPDTSPDGGVVSVPMCEKSVSSGPKNRTKIPYINPRRTRKTDYSNLGFLIGC